MSCNRRWMVAIPIVLSVTAQCRILSLFFFADDFYFFFRFANDRFLPSTIEMFGFHIPILKNLVLWSQFKLFGLWAPPYFATMLALHCVNVIMLYRIILLLTTRTTCALFFASLWGINPILKGVMAWYCAVGYVLSTIIVLFVIHDILRTGILRLDVSYRRAAGWLMLLFAAALTWGIGIAVSCSFFLSLFLFLHGDQRRKRMSLMALALPFACLGSYLTLTYLNMRIGNPHTLDAFRVFNFASPLDALYLFLHLVGHGIAAVVTGPLAVLARSNGQLLALHGVAVFFVSLLTIHYLRRAPKEDRSRLAALGVVAGAIYGLLAIGRVWDMGILRTQATIVSATARYHYAGTSILTIIIAQVVNSSLAEHLHRSLRATLPAAAILAIATMSSVLVSHGRIDYIEAHEACRAEYASALDYIQSNVSTRPEGSTVYIKNRRLSHLVPLLNPQQVFPHTAAVYIMSNSSDWFRGRRVFFIDDDESVRLARRSPGSRAARLLKTESEANDERP